LFQDCVIRRGRLATEFGALFSGPGGGGRRLGARIGGVVSRGPLAGRLLSDGSWLSRK
jgi:hypothetical protein